MRARGSWWTERILPRLTDVALSDATSRRWRELVCSRATGQVLEVGFASGLNLPFYPEAVTEVLAVEPSDLAWERAADRIRDYDKPVTRIGLDGAHLPIPDHSVDTVISTWTMCTIPDVESAVDEFARVLRPGGRLVFVEHVAAVHPRARRIQLGMQPLWGVVAGGCQLHRDIDALLIAHGFAVRELSPRPAADTFELVPFVAGEGNDKAT